MSNHDSAPMQRREFLRVLAATGAAAGLSPLAASAWAASRRGERADTDRGLVLSRLDFGHGVLISKWKCAAPGRAIVSRTASERPAALAAQAQKVR